MIKPLLIALTFMANGQPLTTESAFDLGYKINYLTFCKYFDNVTIDGTKAFYMAISDLTEGEKMMGSDSVVVVSYNDYGVSNA